MRDNIGRIYQGRLYFHFFDDFLVIFYKKDSEQEHDIRLDMSFLCVFEMYKVGRVVGIFFDVNR